MSEADNIKCRTFQKQNVIMKDITDKINKAEGAQNKARHAKELKEETEVFISCPDYDDKNFDCKNCHFIANLRKKMASLIIKAEGLK